VVSLKKKAVLGVEALCRWHLNKHGLIGPTEFIPLAEERGLMVPIGRWALQTACEDIQQWCPNESATCRQWVAVNVSGRQLSHPDFVDEVRQVLMDTGMPPSRLHLEITESVLMENAEASREILASLRRLGVGLSIDDFGTGYSSLAYLRRFPIETLKIDRAFLAKDADAEDSWAIIETIRSLATILGIGVIVEGVETLDHALRLRGLGCQAAQGFLFARPIPSDKVEAYLADVGERIVIEEL
jgi:EAL domain-containing protein (putative c-di-GMP-specific phosphodiesterase class I)